MDDSSTRPRLLSGDSHRPRSARRPCRCSPKRCIRRTPLGSSRCRPTLPKVRFRRRCLCSCIPGRQKKRHLVHSLHFCIISCDTVLSRKCSCTRKKLLFFGQRLYCACRRIYIVGHARITVHVVFFHPAASGESWHEWCVWCTSTTRSCFRDKRAAVHVAPGCDLEMRRFNFVDWKVSEESRNGSLEYVPAQQKGPAGCPPARSLVDFALGWYWYSIVSLSIRPVKSQVLSFSREEPCCYRFHHRRYHPVHSRASERSMNFNFSPKYFLPFIEIAPGNLRMKTRLRLAPRRGNLFY